MQKSLNHTPWNDTKIKPPLDCISEDRRKIFTYTYKTNNVILSCDVKEIIRHDTIQCASIVYFRANTSNIPTAIQNYWKERSIYVART